MNHIRCAALMPHPLVVIPEMGQEEAVKVRTTIQALDAVSQSFKEYNIQTVVIVSPHGLDFGDAITISVHPRLRGTLAAFGAPDLSLGFETDGLLLRTIQKKAERLGINLVEMTDAKAKSRRLSLELDRGAFIPLYFLHKAGFHGQIIHISCGRAPYEEMYTFGKAVQSATAIVDKRIGVVASGDLAHLVAKDVSAEVPFRGAEFDSFVVDVLRRGELKNLVKMEHQWIREIDACALRPLFFLMGSLGGLAVKSQVLSYEAPLGVGYAVAKFDFGQDRPDMI